MADDASDAYGEIAADYAESNPHQQAREAYEWPVVRDLLPAVEGKRVLDVGCGSGYYSRWLAEKGGRVVGLDASEAMLAEARDRNGDVADFLEADLREPLPFDDDRFDLVVSQLTLEHVEDWRHPISEFERVLAPGGRLVVSCDHPFTTYFVIEHEPPSVGAANADAADYYAVERYNRVWWEGDEREVAVPCYRRPLAGVLRPVFGAGFVLEALREPAPPVPDGPHAYFQENTPRFLAFRARTDG